MPPCGPVGPVGPTLSLEPAGPVGPVGPVGPLICNDFTAFDDGIWSSRSQLTEPVVPISMEPNSMVSNTSCDVPVTDDKILPVPLTTTEDTAPVGPVGPTGPVSPVAPVAPVAPVGPTGPVSPVAPVGPVGPTLTPNLLARSASVALHFEITKALETRPLIIYNMAESPLLNLKLL